MTIPGDLSHLQPAHRSYALLADAERVEWIRQERWINYARADQVLVGLSELLRYPARQRMPALLLFGATGMERLASSNAFYASTTPISMRCAARPDFP
jgi:Bacterial TniB protein